MAIFDSREAFITTCRGARIRCPPALFGNPLYRAVLRNTQTGCHKPQHPPFCFERIRQSRSSGLKERMCTNYATLSLPLVLPVDIADVFIQRNMFGAGKDFDPLQQRDALSSGPSSLYAIPQPNEQPRNKTAPPGAGNQKLY
eukprot:2230774-Pyramimonas_sp.AAC.4